MTRPLTEDSPGKQQANYGYRIRQLERRPAPVQDPIEGIDLRAWNYDNTNTWPSQTWTNVANATNESYYQDVFYTTDTTMTYDFDNGIGINSVGLYIIQGWVEFEEDGDPGEVRAASITINGAIRHINDVVEGATSDIIDNRITVATSWMKGVAIGTQGVSLEAWHDSGSTRSLRDAALSVEMIVPGGAMTYEARP